MPTFGPKITRQGDIGIGICPSHQSATTYITTFISSNLDVTADGIPVITIGDIGISTCGHPTIAITGAQFRNVNAKKVHRKDDMGTNPGPYIVVTHSPTTDAL